MDINKQKANWQLLILWLLEGAVVGLGAIVPGISGGTLCVAFGMYKPLIETISNPRTSLKKHWLMLLVFALGIGIGFVGLSGLLAWLFDETNPLNVFVTCVFIGFIIGTFPELWRDAGEQGRKKGAYISVIVGFIVMVAILFLFKAKLSVTIAPGFMAFILCGVLWGLSFIVPGLSSSSFILFFGLYEAMNKGISTFDMGVLIPMALGMAASVLLLSKVLNFAYKKFYSIVSHIVIGIVAATAVMIFPVNDLSLPTLSLKIVSIIAGAIMSYFFTRLCTKLKSKQE